MPRRLSKFALLFAAAMTLSACQRCQKVESDPLQAVPENAQALMVLQPLGALVPAIAGLQRFGESQQESAGSAEQLKTMLGFDPGTIQGLKNAGLDPSRALVATVLDKSETPVIVIPSADQQVLLDTVKRLSEQLGRADKYSHNKIGDNTVHLFARSFGDREVPVAFLALNPKRKLAFLGLGAYQAQSVEALLIPKDHKPLVKSEAFIKTRQTVRQGPLFVWLSGHLSEAMATQVPNMSNAARQLVASLGLSDGAPWLDVNLQLSPEAKQKLGHLLAGANAPDILALGEKGALLAISGHADTQALIDAAEQAQKANPRMQAMARQAGVDINQEMLSKMSGGIGALIYLAPNDNILGALRGPPRSLNAVGGMLAQVLRFHLIAKLKSSEPAAAEEMLGLVDSYFAKRNLTPTQRSVGAVSVHSLELALPGRPSHPVHYTVAQGQLLLGTGTPEAFDRLVQRAQGKGTGDLQKALSSASLKLLQKPGNAMFYLSFSSIVDTLNGLAEDPQVSDPSLHSIALRAAKALHGLGALSLRLSDAPQGIQLQAQLDVNKEARVAKP